MQAKIQQRKQERELAKAASLIVENAQPITIPHHIIIPDTTVTDEITIF